MSTPLYNSAILRLAASIPHGDRLASPHASVDKRSLVCGSRITVDITMEDGRIAALGQEVRACALGQASAALMASHAVGRTPAELDAVCTDLADYLAGRRPDPGEWPGLNVLAAARAHASRHASILLPFVAIAEAARMASLQAAA